MLVERVLPQVVGEKRKLRDCLTVEAQARTIPQQKLDAVLSCVPAELLGADCFLDRLTGLWRYEFGRPFKVGGQLIFGSHMWIEVRRLFLVLSCAIDRLQAEKLKGYIYRLFSNESKHEEVLCEFVPILRLSPDTEVEFEVPTGSGDRDVDWRIIGVDGRKYLLEVKRRIVDFIEMSERIVKGEREAPGVGPAPGHDAALMFRSVEDKFLPADPDIQLQGVWIVSNLQQEKGELDLAFQQLDPTKVHYAVLGGWDPGLKVLVRRDQDRDSIQDLFRESSTDRLHFVRGSDG